MFDIVIVGAGGFGREVNNWALETFDPAKYRIKGFLDDNPNQLQGYSTQIPIVDTIGDYSIQKSDRLIIAIGNVEVKKQLITGLKRRGANFLALIHPSACVAPSARIGEGVVMCPFTTASDHARIDDFAMLHIYASCGHDATIGKYSILSPYATVNGFSVLDDEVFLGTHATVTAYRKIGYRSKISANSAAMQDVPKYGFVFGVPGKTQVIFPPEEL